MGPQADSATRTVLWTVAFGAAVAFVLLASMHSSGAGSVAPVPPARAAAGEQPGPTGSAAADAWAQFSTGTDITVRAEDVAEVRGLMALAEGPANEGASEASGGRATVRYVWCEDDGIEDEEPAPEGERPAHAEHVAVFTFHVPEGRTYYPWARVWWQDSCGNSVFLVLEPEGAQPVQYVVQEGANRWWQWLPVAGPQGVDLPEGPCRLLVRNREDGARLSRVLFATRSYSAHKPETPEG